MRRLLYADRYKLLKSVSYWLFMAVCVILVAAMLFISRDWTEEDLLFQGFSTGPKNIGWALTQMVSDVMLAFFAIPVSLFIGSEFTNGTAKTILAKGYSRKQFFLSKSIMAAAISCSLLAVYMVTSMLVGGFFYGFSATPTELLQMLLYVVLQMWNLCGLTAVWVLISFAARNTTVATVINVLIIFLGKFPVWIVDSILRVDIHSNQYFWVAYCVLDFKTLTPSADVILKMAGISLLYSIVCLAAGWHLFSKSEIK